MSEYGFRIQKRSGHVGISKAFWFLLNGRKHHNNIRQSLVQMLFMAYICGAYIIYELGTYYLQQGWNKVMYYWLFLLFRV